MTHHLAQHLHRQANDEKRLITMESIITTLGDDISHMDAKAVTVAATAAEVLLRSPDIFAVDGDASALTDHVKTWSAYQLISDECEAQRHELCDGTAWDLAIDEAHACDCECGCSAEWAGEL